MQIFFYKTIIYSYIRSHRMWIKFVTCVISQLFRFNSCIDGSYNIWTINVRKRKNDISYEAIIFTKKLFPRTNIEKKGRITTLFRKSNGANLQIFSLILEKRGGAYKYPVIFALSILYKNAKHEIPIISKASISKKRKNDCS